jgi:hypothetical protein
MTRKTVIKYGLLGLLCLLGIAVLTTGHSDTPPGIEPGTGALQQTWLEKPSPEPWTACTEFLKGYERIRQHPKSEYPEAEVRYYRGVMLKLGCKPRD